MGIFSRLTDIINANLNSVLDRAEDPEKMIRQMIHEMEDTLVEVRANAARMIADRKGMARRRQRLDEAQDEWRRKAELALTKDREDLARAALTEKAKLAQDLKDLDEELILLDEALIKYEDDIAKLEAKLREAKAKQKVILARQATATSRLKVRRQVHVFYSLDATAIFTKASDMDSIAFPDPDGPGTAFIASTITDDINNPTSAKQNAGAGGRMVVLASSGESYWHNTAPGPTAPGDCADPETPEGTACDDGNRCTRLDACVGGACVGGDQVVCAPLDGCHLAGVCNPETGQCSNPTAADGVSCDDGNGCTTGDRCVAGACRATGQVECVTPGGCRAAFSTGRPYHRAHAPG